MKQLIKNITDKVLRLFNKRIVPYHSPAKPYLNGVEFLKKIIEKPDLIIDIGVADGTPDLWDTFKLKDNDYLLIEANPKYFEALEKIEENNRERVILEKGFCGEKSETIKFNLNKSGYSSSKYTSYGRTGEISVKCEKLDDTITKHNFTDKRNIFLKIDVEGAELDVLKGAENTLKNCSVVIMETWINVPKSKSPATFAKLIEFMDRHNFVVFDFFSGCNHKNGVLAHLDTVFVKNDSIYRKIEGFD